MDRRGTAGALLALAACIACVTAAPRYSDSTALDLHDSGEPSEGCYYNFQHYGEGDRIMTNEPCLNCTCHNRMLMCYLRVCPFTKPIGQDCTIEKRADQCCPIITCPDVPVDLLTSTSTTSPAEYGMTGVGHLDKYGCSINDKFYPEGSKVPPMPNRPCEHCYCIRNMTTCVMQECTLHVDGCTPIYQKDVCCPVRYSCDHTEDLPLMLDHSTTTEGTTPGIQWTTTVAPFVKVDCVHGDEVFVDGALIKTEKACEHCYCMKGDIVCVVQECGAPMENEGKNCTSAPPREGQCCPDTYICEGDSEPTTEPTRHPIDGYRVEDNDEFSTEGSGFSDATDKPLQTTENNLFIDENQTSEDKTSHPSPTIVVTEEPESVTKEDLSTIKEEDATYTISNTITNKPALVKEDNNLSTTNEAEISQTTLSSVFDEFEHVTEHELSTEKDISKDDHLISEDKTPSPTVTSVTEERESSTKESTYTVTEIPIEEISKQTTSVVTDGMEHVTEDNLPALTVTPKAETYYTTLTSINEASEQVTEDNLSTIKDIPEDKTSVTLIPHVTNEPELVTEGRISTTKEIMEEVTTHSIPSSVTDESKPAVEDETYITKGTPKDGVTTLSPITDQYENASEDSLATIKDIKEEVTSLPTMTEVTKDQYTDDNVSTLNEIPKEESTHTTISTIVYDAATEDTSPVNEVNEHDLSPTTLRSITDAPVVNTASTLVSSEPESATEHNLSTIEHIPKKETSYSTLSSATDESDLRTTNKISYDTTSSSIANEPEHSTEYKIIPETTKDITLGSVTDKSVYTTDKIASTNYEVPKEEHTTTSIETKEETTITPTIKDVVDESHTKSPEEITTHVEDKPVEYTTKSQDTEFSDKTDSVNSKYSTIKPEIYDDKQKETTSKPETTSYNLIKDETSESVTDKTSIKEVSTDHIPISTVDDIYESKKSTPIYETTDKAEFTTLQHKEGFSTGHKDEVTTESDATKIYEEDFIPKVTNEITITEHPETTSYKKDERLTTVGEHKEQTTSPTTQYNKDSEVSVTSQEPTEQEAVTTAATSIEMTHDQTTSSNVESSTFDAINNEEEVTEHKYYTTSAELELSSVKLPSEQPSKEPINPEVSEKDLSTTENIISYPTTEKSIHDDEKQTVTSESQETLTSKVPQSDEDVTKGLDQNIEMNKITTESVIPEVEKQQTTTTLSSTENEVSDEDNLVVTNKPEYDDDQHLEKQTTIKPEIDYTTEALEEPDKGLNTVPVEPLEEETGKVTTESSQKDSQTTPLEFVTNEQIIHEKDKPDSTIADTFISTTTAKFDESIVTEQTLSTDAILHDHELSTSMDTSKDITTEVPETKTSVLVEATTAKIDDLTENEIPEEHAPHIPSPGIIPGEGSCLVEGVTYNNNSIVPSTNKCQSNCKCVSSIIKCDPIHCSPPPEYMINCQPVYDASDSCCPSYICDDSKETLPPQPHSQMSVTESTSAEKCGENCEADLSTSKPKLCNDTVCEVEEEVIKPVKHSELCTSSKCSPTDTDVSVTEKLTTIQEDTQCKGANCDIVPSTSEVVPPEILLQPGTSTEKSDIECMGDACTVKHIPESEKQPSDCLPGNDCDQPIEKESECVGETCVNKETVTTLSEETLLDNTEKPIDKILTTEEIPRVTEHTMTTVHSDDELKDKQTSEHMLSSTQSIPIESEVTTEYPLKEHTQSSDSDETSKPVVREKDEEETLSSETFTISPDVKTTIIMSLQSEASQSPYTSEYIQPEEESKPETTPTYDGVQEDKTTNVGLDETKKETTETSYIKTNAPIERVTEDSTLYSESSTKTEDIATEKITKTTEQQPQVVETETTTPYFVELVEHPHMIDDNINVTTEEEYVTSTVKDIEEDIIKSELTTLSSDHKTELTTLPPTKQADDGLNTIQPVYSTDHTTDTKYPVDKQSTTTEKLKHDESTTAPEDTSSNTPKTDADHKDIGVMVTDKSEPTDGLTTQTPDSTEHKLYDNDIQTTSSPETEEHIHVSEVHESSSSTVGDDEERTTLAQEVELTTLKSSSEITPLHEDTTSSKPSNVEHTPIEIVTEKELELEHTSESIDDTKKKTEDSVTSTTVDDSIIVFVDEDVENVTHKKDVTEPTSHESTSSEKYDYEQTTQQVSKQTETSTHKTDEIDTTSIKSHDIDTTEEIVTSIPHDEVPITTVVQPHEDNEPTSVSSGISQETTTYKTKFDEFPSTDKPNVEDTTIISDLQEKSTIIPEVQTTILPEVQSSILPEVHSSILPQVQSSILPEVQSSNLPDANLHDETTISDEISKSTSVNDEVTTTKTLFDKESSEHVTKEPVYESESTTKLNIDVTPELRNESTTVVTEVPPTVPIVTDEDMFVEISTKESTITEKTTPQTSYETEKTSEVSDISSTEKVSDILHEESTSIKPHIDVTKADEISTTYTPVEEIHSDDLTTIKTQEDISTPTEGTHIELSTVTEHAVEQTSPIEEMVTQAEIMKATSESIIPSTTESSIPIEETSQDSEQQPIEESVEVTSKPEFSDKPAQESSSEEDSAKYSTINPNKYYDETSSPEISSSSESLATDIPKPLVTQKPEEHTSAPVDDSDQENQEFPQSASGGYGHEPDYGDDDQAFGPGTCRYGGKVYVSAQQIPRDDPCDFCFCFRSDIICLQQSCPPPIHGCHEEPIQGFCCPRYECPVSMATSLNMTTTTTTTTTTLPPHFLPHAYKGAAQRKGCQIKGHSYQVGEVVRASSGPCLHCTCGGDGQMKCDPKACTPEPMLRQMIAAAVASKRRR